MAKAATPAAPVAPARPDASDAVFASQLNEYMCAGYQALYIPTSEEARVEHEIEKIATDQLGTNVVTWDQFDGFTARPGTTLPAEFADKTKWLDPVVAIGVALNSLTMSSGSALPPVPLIHVDAVRTNIENKPEAYLPFLGMSASMFRQDRASSDARSISAVTGRGSS